MRIDDVALICFVVAIGALVLVFIQQKEIRMRLRIIKDLNTRLDIAREQNTKLSISSSKDSNYVVDLNNQLKASEYRRDELVKLLSDATETIGELRAAVTPLYYSDFKIFNSITGQQEDIKQVLRLGSVFTVNNLTFTVVGVNTTDITNAEIQPDSAQLASTAYVERFRSDQKYLKRMKFDQ